MRHFAAPSFWACYRTLPQPVRELADKNYELLKANPSHPSLHFKKVGKYRAVRVGLHYRALAVEAGDDLLWFWIGSHSEYDKLVGSLGGSERSLTAPAALNRNPHEPTIILSFMTHSSGLESEPLRRLRDF